MTARQLLALWGALAILLSLPVGAHAAKRPDPLAGRDWGTVTGYLLDRESGRPIPGARVVIAHDGAFAEGGRTVGATDKDGRYRVDALIGRRSSHFDLMSLVEGFPLGLFAPWGMFKQTRIVDARQFMVKAEAPGYKPFLGIVAAQVASGKRYTAHALDVLLATQDSALASAAPPDRPREQLLSYTIEPAIAAPGDKVTFTARFRLPQDGVSYTAGWYTADRLFRVNSIPMRPLGKPDAETGVTTFQAVMEIPKRPHGNWAVFGVWLDRERTFQEVQFRGTREVLLQVAPTPTDRAAAEVVARAFALEQQDRPAEALECYREAAAQQPKRVALWSRLGQLALQLNRAEEAVDAFHRFAQANPAHPEVTAAPYAGALLAVGQTQRALEMLTDVEKKVDKRRRLPREFLVTLARAYLAQNDLHLADSYYARAVKMGRVPQDVARQFHLERARAAVKVSPNSPDAREGLGRALFDLQRYEEAVAEYRQAAQLDAANVWAYIDAANCLSALGRDREALPYLQQAVTIAPNNMEARLALAEGCRRAGDFPRALDAYRAVAAAPAHRNDFIAQHGLGLMLLAAGDGKGAMEVLARAVELGREKGRLTGTRIGTGLGVLALTPKRVTINGFLHRDAEWDYALLGSLHLLARQPENALARYQGGVALIELGLAEKGLEWVNKAAAHGFAPTDGAYAVASAHLRAGRVLEGRRLLEKVAREDPGHRRALLALARLAFDEGDVAGGQAWLLRAQPAKGADQ